MVRIGVSQARNDPIVEVPPEIVEKARQESWIPVPPVNHKPLQRLNLFSGEPGCSLEAWMCDKPLSLLTDHTIPGYTVLFTRCVFTDEEGRYEDDVVKAVSELGELGVEVGMDVVHLGDMICTDGGKRAKWLVDMGDQAVPDMANVALPLGQQQNGDIWRANLYMISQQTAVAVQQADGELIAAEQAWDEPGDDEAGEEQTPERMHAAEGYMEGAELLPNLDNEDNNGADSDAEDDGAADHSSPIANSIDMRDYADDDNEPYFPEMEGQVQYAESEVAQAIYMKDFEDDSNGPCFTEMEGLVQYAESEPAETIYMDDYESDLGQRSQESEFFYEPGQ